MPQSPILIRLFGPPEFRVSGEPMPRPKTRKSLYILALLALRHGREVERSWLAGTLWPENDDATALTYLRQSLTDLRRALGDAGTARLLSPSPRTLRLAIEDADADVDTLSFERLLKRGDAASLEAAVSLYRGPLLEGWAEDWLLNERETFAQSYLAALETLGRQAMVSGDNASAVPYLRRIVAADPLRESACRALMGSLAATRDFGAVTQAYRELRVTLRREVGSEPDAETQALFARLRADARRQATTVSPPDRANVPARAAAPVARPDNGAVSLPRPLSEFIGRRREVESVKRALAVSRLVTLTGIGGVGKTRLAIRVASEVADDFPDGVRFLDLSPLSDPALVAKTAAVALGVAEGADVSLTEAIASYLRERHLLLVFDNCEHLLEECARFAAALLPGCPNLRILATSRQRLGVAGETARPVPPLTLPERKPLLDEDKNDAAALLEYEAVRLFVDRAQRVQPNLPLNPPTLRAIAVICRRLDGIPLALELAAARMSALGPEQIAVRLTERFRLLSGGDRSSPARQRTLRAALDWSHDLLLVEEQVLLRRLCLFAGGFTLEAAEAVCAGEGLQEWEVLDALTGLVNHSLVVVEAEDARTRYRLLETVREYARERLRECAAVELGWLRVRRREYFLRLAQEAVPHLGRREEPEWLNRLEREHDNLQATLDDCLEEGTPDAARTGLQLAVALLRFWTHRGYAGEGRKRYAALLARAGSEPTPERAGALEGAAALAFRQSEYPAAREMLNAALDIHRQRGDRFAEAKPLGLLGNIARIQGDYAGARELYARSLALFRESGHRMGQGTVLSYMANAAVEQGDFAEAGPLYKEALAISREVGDTALEASILNGLGRLTDFQNDFAGARVWFEQSLALHRELGDYSQVAIITYNLGNNAQALGDMAAAQDHYRQALALTRELGESRSRRLIAFLLTGLAFTASANGLPERAARLLGASEAEREAIGVPLHPDDRQEHERLVAELQAALGDKRFSALRDEGRLMRVAEAVAVALE